MAPDYSGLRKLMQVEVRTPGPGPTPPLPALSQPEEGSERGAVAAEHLAISSGAPSLEGGDSTEVERPREAGRLRAKGWAAGLTHTSDLQKIPEFLLPLLLKPDNGLLIFIH